ncbi:MAG: flagellar biosynthetic protein FliR [Geobacteraceae bacterium GWC2_55_20]|nr:MAG: flagellar biosynthetic protein FliR [Geobacteraceae bacterium GWC2_55_20]OGU24777.1 MAG: flagellar biosynthetic protein FliR [Geobacteraceae bacterium GWF2_54_21]HBA71339.1 flagellar biosynthetic protein FliR [Geobacter sp.]HCE68750.1 flagellar biosynthetic protein FliR [Geobacter sp.]
MFPLLPFPSPREVIFFMLVLSRVAGIFAALPVFGGRRLPIRIKVVTVFMITLVCFPTLSIAVPETPTDVFSLGLLALSELMVGLTLAFITQIIFAAVEFSGQIIGMQMGFTISSIIDPSQGTQTQIMSVVQTLFATLMFLSLNIHHLFIRAIIDSFRVIPLGGWHLNGELLNFLIQRTADIFIIGIRLAAPVMVALLLTTVALGIMARSFPQMNVFMISMPLNIGLGLIILGMTLTIFFHVLEVSFGHLKGQIDTLYRLMAKGG